MCFKYGEGVQKNVSKAIKIFKKVSDAGYWFGLFIYGYSFYSGQGIGKDLIQAASYFKKSSDLGCEYSMYFYGICLVNGSGVERNYLEAFNFFKKAHENKYDDASRLVAIMIDEGKIVEQNIEEATLIFQELSNRYDLFSVWKYGYSLIEGRGIHKSFQRGIDLVENAANQGVGLAQIYLSSLIVNTVVKY